MPFFFQIVKQLPGLVAHAVCSPISKSSDAPERGSGLSPLSLNAGWVRSRHSFGSGVPLLLFPDNTQGGDALGDISPPI